MSGSCPLPWENCLQPHQIESVSQRREASLLSQVCCRPCPDAGKETAPVGSQLPFWKGHGSHGSAGSLLYTASERLPSAAGKAQPRPCRGQCSPLASFIWALRCSLQGHWVAEGLIWLELCLLGPVLSRLRMAGSQGAGVPAARTLQLLKCRSCCPSALPLVQVQQGLAV